MICTKMSGRLLDCFPPLLQDALFSGLDLATLGATAIADPDCTNQAVFQYTVERQRRYVVEQKEKLDTKYHYLMCQIHWITIYAHFSNTRTKCNIALRHRIQYDEAIKWYHRSKWYYNNEMNLVLIHPHDLFIRMWLKLHPEDEGPGLRHELLLSDEAMKLIHAKRPDLSLHQIFMEKMESIEVDMPWDLIPRRNDLLKQIDNEIYTDMNYIIM